MTGAAIGDDRAACENANLLNVQFGQQPRRNDASAIYPYQVMGEFLRDQKRDIVFSLCQYGMVDVWKWGGSVNGNCWRTTGDINDTWRSMSGIGFKQDKAAPYRQAGKLERPRHAHRRPGWLGQSASDRLTPDEQYTHISLWCLLSAPLLIGCDMTKLDDFTLNLLATTRCWRWIRTRSANRRRAFWSADGDRARVMKRNWTMADARSAFSISRRGSEIGIQRFHHTSLIRQKHRS